MSFILGNFLYLGKEVSKIVNSRVGYSVLKIEVGSNSIRDTYLIFFLILVNHFPENICAKLFLKADGHYLTFFDLYPLNSIYFKMELL